MSGAYVGTLLIGAVAMFLIFFTLGVLIVRMPRIWGENIAVDWELEPDDDGGECSFCERKDCTSDDCLNGGRGRGDRWSGIEVGPCRQPGSFTSAAEAIAANAATEAAAGGAPSAAGVVIRDDAINFRSTAPTATAASALLKSGHPGVPLLSSSSSSSSDVMAPPRILSRTSLGASLSRTAIGNRIGVTADGSRQRRGKRSGIGKRRFGPDRYGELRPAHTSASRLASQYQFPTHHLRATAHLLRQSNMEKAHYHAYALRYAEMASQPAPPQGIPLSPQVTTDELTGIPLSAHTLRGIRSSGVVVDYGRSVGAFHSRAVRALARPLTSVFGNVDDVERYVYAQDMSMFKCAFTGRLEQANRALCVGINYRTAPPHIPRLENCHNDAELLTCELAIRHFGVTQPLLITEETFAQPIFENLAWALRWGVHEAMPGQHIYFHFSVHGTNILDQAARARDHELRRTRPMPLLSTSASSSSSSTRLLSKGDDLQDSIITSDGRRILDDDLYEWVVRPLDNTGATLLITNDSCRNATLFELPHLYSVNATLTGLQEEHRRPPHEPLNCNVICMSACRDDEDADDGPEVRGLDGKKYSSRNGAFTRALVTVLKERGPTCSIEQMAIGIQRIFQTDAGDGPRQHVQISSMRPLDLTTPFCNIFASCLPPSSSSS